MPASQETTPAHGSTREEENKPLLPSSHETELTTAQLHTIFRIIYDQSHTHHHNTLNAGSSDPVNETDSDSTVSSDTPNDECEALQNVKKIAGSAAIIGRIIACGFRFVVISDGANHAYRVIQQISDTSYSQTSLIINIAAGTFTAFDAFLTSRKTASRIYHLFSHPNYFIGLKQFGGDIFDSAKAPLLELAPFLARILTKPEEPKYPLKLLFSAFLTMIGSGMKSFVGTMTFWHMLSRIAPKAADFDGIGYTLAALIAFSACISSVAFMFLGKACTILRIQNKLNTNLDWQLFQKQNQSWLTRQSIKGAIIAAVNSLIGGTAAFYHKGRFDIEPMSIVYFVFITLGSMYFNYFIYCKNHTFELVRKMHEAQEDCQDCIVIPTHEKSCAQKTTAVIGYPNALGDFLLHLFPFMETVQIAMLGIALMPHCEGVKNDRDNPWVLLPFLVIGLILSGLAAAQGLSMWANVAHKKPTALNREDPEDVAPASLTTHYVPINTSYTLVQETPSCWARFTGAIGNFGHAITNCCSTEKAPETAPSL